MTGSSRGTTGSSSDSSSGDSWSGEGLVTFDTPIHSVLGLEYLALNPSLVLASFTVGKWSMQISGQLHGGVSALVAESAASVGAAVASGQMVLGLDVTCSHLRGASVGTQVLVVGRPLRAGRLIQVWEVRLYNITKGAIDPVPAQTRCPSAGTSADGAIPPVSSQTRSHSAETSVEVTRLPGVAVRKTPDADVALLVTQVERDESCLIAVARVTCLVRTMPARNGENISGGIVAPRSKL